MNNPLLSLQDLPDFSAIRAEHVTPAVTDALQAAEAALEQALAADGPSTYASLSACLDQPQERLGRVWGAVSHLHHVADTPELRAAYTENLPRITEFHTRLSSDERLYAKYKAIAQEEGLTSPQRQVLSHALRDFRLGGAELQGAAKARFAEIQQALAEASQQFSEHVMDATDGFTYLASEAEVAGIPDDVLSATRAAAEAKGQQGFLLTLHQPVLVPVLQYAQHRPLRERLYTAYVTRASDLGDPKLDNSALMGRILALRQEEAELLGYANHGEVSLVAKMAESPAQVVGFLQELGRKARPFAERDMAQLRDFARDELGLPDLQAWDQAYASEQLQQARYAFSDQEVKQYFTEPKVLEGLFRIIETLFEVRILPDQAPVWHPSVRFFRIEREGQLIGQFFYDGYARPGKQPGAWMDDARGRWRRPDGQLQTPVAHLVCNFAPPTDGKPALLTHGDVTTLFHEFGHGLHHLLTQVEELGVAGISGVEWDAVELPSQFMENFCWEWDVLQGLTAHVETGQALPRALYDKMMAAKNFQSGLFMLRQLEFGLVDMTLHTTPGAHQQVQALIDQVRREVAVVRYPAFNRSTHSFSHIFAGGYSAGYFSYKWAEVLSADAFSAFEETSPLSVETGRRYRREILEMGGSRPAMASFVAFRGREPQVDALLRHSGLAEAA